MRLVNSYNIRIILKRNQRIDELTRSDITNTLSVYRKACVFITNVCNIEWHEIKQNCSTSKERINYVEHLIHGTKNNKYPKYSEFDTTYHKLPSYLRRAAISFAIGSVSSYYSNLEDWLRTDEKERGEQPKLGTYNHDYPTFYKDKMFKLDNDDLRLKVFNGKDWVWKHVTLRYQDVKYVRKYCSDDVRSNPTLARCNNGYALSFAYERERELSDKHFTEQRVCAVDLGINTHATMCVMTSDGTIIDRKFVHFGKEEDRLNKLLGHLRKRQSRYRSRSLRNEWGYIKSYNSGLSKKIAHEIVSYACEHECDVIVMEYLDFERKISGSRRYRLSMWRKREIQRVVMNQAHVHGMHFNRVCAWNTSRLAFDGSGVVTRGKDAGFGTYSLCRFRSVDGRPGKVYNCDLNASYNIGARYFIREFYKSMPVKVWQVILTKVSELSRRTCCTLSSLISLNAVVNEVCLVSN